jgi:hypothetical protein
MAVVCGFVGIVLLLAVLGLASEFRLFAAWLGAVAVVVGPMGHFHAQRNRW